MAQNPPDTAVETSPAVIPHWHDPDSDRLTIVEGDGATIYDDEGHAYLDFMSQLACVNAGHGNQAILTAMQEQADSIAYVGPHHNNDARTALAAEITQLLPDSLTDIYFAISGSEANETAIQFARAAQDAPKILTRWRSYHGWTYGTGSLSGDPATREFERHATTTGSVKFLPPLAYRNSPFEADSPADLSRQAAEHLEYVIRNENPDTIAALLMEPVAGASGAYPPPPGYFERVRDLCDQHDILLIADEVITGFGRCGDWFGIQADGITPDLLTFAKGVTSSYAPLAGVAVSDDLSTYIRSEGTSIGQTFAGSPTACAAGLAAIDEYRAGLLDNVHQLAPTLQSRLEALAREHAVVGDVRGRGFLWSVEFTDPATDEPFVDPRVDDGPNPVKDVVAAAKENGVICTTGRPGFQILLAPPFCITDAEIDDFIEAFDAAITSVFA